MEIHVTLENVSVARNVLENIACEETYDIDDIACTLDEDGVMSIYVILLARHPDESAKSYVGQPVAYVALDLLSSMEFRGLVEIALDNCNALAHDLLPHLEVNSAARWMIKRFKIRDDFSQITPAFMLATFIYWALGIKDLDFDYIGFAQILRKKVSSEKNAAARLAKIFFLNQAWCLRNDTSTALALARGEYSSFEAAFLNVGFKQGQKLFPALSENNTAIYESISSKESLSFDDIVKALKSAFDEGRLSHWLFDATYYKLSLERSQKSRADITSGSTYKSFLSSNCVANPHPLFCWFACLNESERKRELASLLSIGPRHDGAAARFLEFIALINVDDVRCSLIFDPHYYSIFNPSAVQRIDIGKDACFLADFINYGINYDLPFSPDFDLDFYQINYPDVKEAALRGDIPSITWHFVYKGLVEGRQPNPYFNPDYYLRRHPHARREMVHLGIASELEHFLLLGRARGWRANPPLVGLNPDMMTAKSVFARSSRRHYANIRANPLDFRPFLATEICLSVVVPVSGEIEMTAQFLTSAHAACQSLDYELGLKSEIIFVVNGGDDDTVQILNSCKGLIIIDLERPSGFPMAVNRGVKEARGRILLIANNDITFGANTFKIAVETLDDRTDIGILGALVILPNETLQEAGSFLDNQANVVGLGRGENPWDLFFQGIREADYCTGCFTAIRAKDFDSLDGFDEAFSPGYYEETDLSFRMKDAIGKGAYINSRIQVTHFEHASFGKGRPPTASHALIKANQRYFVSKHVDRLRDHPASLQLLTSHNKANVITLKRKKVLIIEDLIPDQRLGSGFGRIQEVLRVLIDVARVPLDLFIMSANEITDEFFDPRVDIIRSWMVDGPLESYVGRIGVQYSDIIVCRTHNLARFGSVLEELRVRHGLRIICDTEALSSLRIIERERILKRDGRHDIKSLVQSELDCGVRVHKWIAVSRYEANVMIDAGMSNVSVIGHPMQSRVPSEPLMKKFRILAVGAVHSIASPNYDGMVWFFEQVLLKVGVLAESFIISIVGFWDPDALAKMREKYSSYSIQFLGVLSQNQLRNVYEEAIICIAPTRFAAGIAIKVLESFAFRVPIVLTDILEKQLLGIEAFGESGLASAVRDDQGVSFANWIRLLLTDEVARESVCKAQDKLFLDLCSVKNFETSVSELLD